MIRALFLKELRALRPVALCIVGMLVIGYAFELAGKHPDEFAFDLDEWMRDDRIGAFIVLALFGMMAGAGLLVSENAQGTLRFLDGLPVSRTQIFFAKVLAALGVLALVPVLAIPIDVLLWKLSATSLSPPLPWAFAVAQVGLQVLAGAFLLALAMAVSFARGWFALIVGLLFWASIWMRLKGMTWVNYINPAELLRVGLDGGRVLVSWRIVAGHGVATLLLVGFSWMTFARLGDRAPLTLERIGRWRWLNAMGTALKFLAPVVWIAAVALAMRDVPPSDDDPLKKDTAFGRRETPRYEFLFRSSQRQEADPLIDAADETYDAVAAFFGTPALPSRIVVDLASPVMPHAAGQTTWTKIRMPLELNPGLERQRLVLAHETAHVFIEHLGQGQLSRIFDNVRFLHEGLAQFVEQSVAADEAERRKSRLTVAAAWSRGAIPFSQLCSSNELTRHRDGFLVYPLGAIFAGALVECHGTDAPARLLRAFGRKKAPVGLKDAELWRDTMQASGLDFDRVTASYTEAASKIAAEEAEFLAKFPRLSATVAIEGSRIVVRPKFEGDAPGEMTCAIESDDGLTETLRRLDRAADGTFTLPRSSHTKPTLRYLLGWKTDETQLPIFEPWAEAVLKP